MQISFSRLFRTGRHSIVLVVAPLVVSCAGAGEGAVKGAGAGALAGAASGLVHALAGLWIQALTFEDQGDKDGLLAITPEIIHWDREINDQTQFDRELEDAYQGLIGIRAEYSLPLRCT